MLKQVFNNHGIKPVTRILLSTGTTLMVVISFALLYLGTANVITCLIIYSFAFATLSFTIGKVSPSWKGSNRQISYWALFLAVILVELGLRYITKTNLAYSEQNGAFNYLCPFGQIKLENIGRRYIYGQQDVRFRLGPHSKTKDYEKPEFDYQHAFNSLGLREKEITRTQLDTSFTVLGLGDSFTEGIGTPADSTWISQLGKLLGDSIPNVLAINGGSSGSDVFYESYKLRYLLYDKYKPDLVVFALNATDIFDVIVRGGNERFVSAGTLKYKTGPPWRYLYCFSHITRLILHNIFNIKAHYFIDREYEMETEKAKRLIADEVIKELMPYAKEKGFGLLLVFTPMADELHGGNFLLSGVYEKVNRADSAWTLNLYEAVSTSEPETYTRYYWPVDQHCNSRGYLKWAQLIEKKLMQNIRQPGGSQPL